MEIAYSRSSVGYLLGEVLIWGEAVLSACSAALLVMQPSYFYLPISTCLLGGSKHSPYIHNLQWQCQPIKSLDCLLMPRGCWPIRVMWLKITHTDSCCANQEMTHNDSSWLMLCKAVLCLVNLSLTLSYVLSNEKDMKWIILLCSRRVV